ncbi:MAG: hypothetical protein WBD22_03470 [Pyrinomonadaceae bacterium]
MERAFQIVAVILGSVAAYFLWYERSEGAFVTAVLGAVAFFLSIRFQVKERNRRRLEGDLAGSDLGRGPE